VTERKSPQDDDKARQLVAGARREREQREREYRERALKLFPPVCARCGREFSGRKLRELTVHHKDHNHANNPPDGGNWELLCLYCHDDMHQRSLRGEYGEAPPSANQEPTATYKPFAGLDSLLKRKK